MRLLLDTHVFLWWRSDIARISKHVQKAIRGADLVFVSAASAWEATFKVALGKLRLPESFTSGVDDSGFLRLNVAFSHAELAPTLPPHHADRFDRMLIAQAIVEGLELVTHDRVFERYTIPILWT